MDEDGNYDNTLAKIKELLHSQVVTIIYFADVSMPVYLNFRTLNIRQRDLNKRSNELSVVLADECKKSSIREHPKPRTCDEAEIHRKEA